MCRVRADMLPLSEVRQLGSLILVCSMFLVTGFVSQACGGLRVLELRWVVSPTTVVSSWC